MYYEAGRLLWSTQLTRQDKEMLELPFSMEEVRSAIVAMRGESVPGPNGFGVNFFKKDWDLTKKICIICSLTFMLRIRD